jgi:hypothetical protein
MRNSSHQDRSIVHLEAENLVKISFANFAHGDALLGSGNAHSDLLKYIDIECAVAFAQLFFLSPKPSSGSVVKVAMGLVMMRGCHGFTPVR